MNVFRFAGDMTHLFSVLVLLLKIYATKSCSGPPPANPIRDHHFMDPCLSGSFFRCSYLLESIVVWSFWFLFFFVQWNRLLGSLHWFGVSGVGFLPPVKLVAGIYIGVWCCW